MNKINFDAVNYCKYLETDNLFPFVNKAFSHFHYQLMQQNELKKIDGFIKNLALLQFKNNQSPSQKEELRQVLAKEIKNYRQVLKESEFSKTEFVLTRYIHYFGLQKLFTQYHIDKTICNAFFEKSTPTPEQFLRTLFINYPDIFTNSLKRLLNPDLKIPFSPSPIARVFENHSDNLLIENKNKLLVLLEATFDRMFYFADKAQFYQVMQSLKETSLPHWDKFLSELAKKIVFGHAFYQGQTSDVGTYWKRISVIEDKRLLTLIPQKNETYHYLKIKSVIGFILFLRKNPSPLLKKNILNSLLHLTKANNYDRVINCLTTLKKNLYESLINYKGDLDPVIDENLNSLFPNLKLDLKFNYALKKGLMIDPSGEHSVGLQDPIFSREVDKQRAYAFAYKICLFYHDLKCSKNSYFFIKKLKEYFSQFPEKQLQAFKNLSSDSFAFQFAQHLTGLYLFLNRYQEKWIIPAFISVHLKELSQQNFKDERKYHASIRSLQLGYLMATLKEYSLADAETVYDENLLPNCLRDLEELKTHFRSLSNPLLKEWKDAFEYCAQQFNSNHFSKIWTYILEHFSAEEKVILLNKACSCNNLKPLVGELWNVLENWRVDRSPFEVLTFLNTYVKLDHKDIVALDLNTHPWILNFSLKKLPSLTAFGLGIKVFNQFFKILILKGDRLSSNYLEAVANYLNELIYHIGSGKILQYVQFSTKRCRPRGRVIRGNKNEKKEKIEQTIISSTPVQLILMMLNNLFKRGDFSKQKVIDLLLNSDTKLLNSLFHKTAMNFIIQYNAFKNLNEQQILKFSQVFLQSLKILHAKPLQSYGDFFKDVPYRHVKIFYIHPTLKELKLSDQQALPQINKIFIQILERLSSKALTQTLFSIIDFYTTVNESPDYSYEYKEEVKLLLNFYKQWLIDSFQSK